MGGQRDAKCALTACHDRRHRSGIGVCGVPLSAPLEVRADGNLLSSRVASLRIDAAAPFATLDLALQAMAPDQAVLRGDVLDLVGTPLDNAVVELPQLKLRAVTDAKGAFRIPQVPAGETSADRSPTRLFTGGFHHRGGGGCGR
jgi:hypothetical protein